MKHFRILTTIIAAWMCFSISESYAQQQNSNWREKMMSEKIAFLTKELSLTTEEAQTFWPVYNKISDEIFESQKAIKAAYRALEQAVENGASEKELNELVDAYLTVRQDNCCKNKEHVEQFRSILSSEKVAKLYIAEEKHRRYHIRSMKTPQKPSGQEKGLRNGRK